MENIIKFENVHFSYPGEEKESLCGIELEIRKGSFTAVLGRNGSGKSTLAKHMNGIFVPTEGRVLVNGLDTAIEENLLAIRRNVGMVFQNPDNQIVANVVEEDVAFAPENLGIEPAEIRRRVDEALKQVGMFEYREHAPHLLSGGQKQRIGIAGVIAMEPEIIVLDEPTAMLDPRGRREVISTVSGLCRDKGMTVVLITHHMDECIGADRLIIMDKGSITADGSPAEVFSQLEMLEGLGLSVPETARTIHELNALGAGIPFTALTPEACAAAIKNAMFPDTGSKEGVAGEGELPKPAGLEGADTEKGVCVKELRHVYSAGTPFEKTAIDNISISIPAGQTIGIIGHTGSGKSTFIQHLNALLKPTSGKVMFEGRDINADKFSRRDIKFKVGLVFQYPEYQLFEETVYKDIAFGPGNMKLSAEEIDARVKEAAGFVGIDEEKFESSPLDHSGGQKRRIAIAGVIAMRPELLILDEPTAGLDPSGSKQILDNILEYKRKTGSTVIIVSHNMDDTARISDRIIVFNGGAIAADGTPEQIYSDPEALTGMSLDVPHSTELALELKRAGVPIEGPVFTHEGLMSAILKAKEAEKC